MITQASPILDKFTFQGSSATAEPGDGAMVAEVEHKMADFSLPEELHHLMSAVGAPILCFLGIVGNLLSIITWCRPKMRSSTGRYLIGQAMADLGVLLFVFADSLQDMYPSVKYSPPYGWFYSYIGYPGLYFTFVCSIWYTVGLTADRYIMVCWITKSKQYCNEKRATLGLVLITINAFIINIPHHLSFEPYHYADNESKYLQTTEPLVLMMSYQTTAFTNSASGQFYEFWIHCMFLLIIPWFSVLFMNMTIINKVTKSNKNTADKKTLQAAKNSKASENQITRLLLTVTFSFLFFIAIQCVVQCLFVQRPPGASWFYIDSTFAFAKCAFVFNSSTNFFLYCFSGRRFRKELLAVLGLADVVSQLSSLMSHSTSSGSNNGTSTSTGQFEGSKASMMLCKQQ